MEYVVKKGFFYGKKKAKYEVGEVLVETELYKDRLDYFVKIGMLGRRPVVIDVAVAAPVVAPVAAPVAAPKVEAKPKKSKKSAKDSDIL